MLMHQLGGKFDYSFSEEDALEAGLLQDLEGADGGEDDVKGECLGEQQQQQQQ